MIRNITRRRGRFAFTLLGITIGIASFVTFLSLGGSLKKEIRREAAALGANLVVTPKGSCAYEQVSILTGEQLPTNITMEEVAKVRGIAGITALPFLTEKTAIGNRPVPVVGVLPVEMKAFRQWKVQRGSYFDNATAVVAGAAAAERYGLAPGSPVTIRGERFTVSGVLAETGSRDDLTLFLPLQEAQRVFKAGEHVSYIAVRVEELAKAEYYATRIRETVNLGVVSDRQMLNSVLSIVGSVNITLQMIAAVAVLAAAFGIINTMMTATYERKREIGILQALGARRGTIFTIFLLESGFYGLLGGIAGVTTGMLVSVAAAPYISQNAFTAFVKGSGGAGVDPYTVVSSVFFSTVVAVAAGLFPAWRAARLSPVEAISYE